MRKVVKNVALAVLASAFISSLPSYADADKALALEQAQLKYIISYQALQKAKQSTNTETKSNLAKFVKYYREAYAQYLQLLKNNELYNPTEKDFNPADEFNEREFNNNRIYHDWNSADPYEFDNTIKNLVDNGKTPDAVVKTVMDSLPDDFYSEETDDCPERENPVVNTGDSPAVAPSDVDTQASTPKPIRKCKSKKNPAYPDGECEWVFDKSDSGAFGYGNSPFGLWQNKEPRPPRCRYCNRAKPKKD